MSVLENRTNVYTHRLFKCSVICIFNYIIDISDFTCYFHCPYKKIIPEIKTLRWTLKYGLCYVQSLVDGGDETLVLGCCVCIGPCHRQDGTIYAH